MCSETKVTLGLLVVFFCVVSHLDGGKIEKVNNVTSTTSTTSTTATPVDQTAVESQLPIGKVESKNSSSSVTTTMASVVKAKGRKPSCYVVFKDMEAHPGYGSNAKGKMKMACTICNYRGYQENCVFANKHIMRELSETDDKAESTTPLAGQESRQSATYQESTEAIPETKSENYVPVYETTAVSSVDDESKAGIEDDVISDRMETKNEDESVKQPEDDREDDSVEESKDGKGDDDSANESEDRDDDRGNQSYDGPRRSSGIPDEYMESEYDPQFYESHDEAAETFHPYVFSKSPYETEDGKESRHSSSSVMPGFDVLRSVLPDVEPINPDKDVKPRKRQKTVEYTEQVSFSSDDDTGKKSSNRRPVMDYNGQHSNNDDNYYQPTHYGSPSRQSKSSGHSGSDYYGGYKPPIDMPAFDSKDCTVRYKDSPQGGPRMKCVNCKGKTNAYSEECGVEYEQPTKHREVTYDTQNYNADPKAVMRMMQGAYSEMPGSYNAPYYDSNPYAPRRNNKGSASIKKPKYIPFKGYYNPYY